MTRDEELFYRLLRLSLGVAQEFPVDTDAAAWRRLYQTAARQSLLGVCYKGLCLMAADRKAPVDVALPWASEAEMIRGLNELLNAEAALLTKAFAEKGRSTAILKGQANALLYPDRLARQPGDIDIWVSGGRKSVTKLMDEMGMMVEDPLLKTSYHHIHLPPNERGVTVEVHFRPSSGNFNPLTNRRLQRWLEGEIPSVTMVEQGFCVPSVRFALVMQLAHIQHHFLSSGIGLRQVCDYYWLLRFSTVDNRREVSALLGRFGLAHAAGALMWVLGEILSLDTALMLCEPDGYRGEWMLREMMEGGNFGCYATRQQHGLWRRVFESKRQHLQLMRFDFWEVLWQEVNYWVNIVRTLPTRIKYRTLSLRDITI